MKNLAFDLDGVLYDWQNVAFQYCSEYFKKEFDYDTFWTVTIKNLSKTFLDNLVSLEFLYLAKNTDKRIVHLLNKLSESNSIYYITKRAENLRVVTEMWLDKEGFPDRDNLYLSKDKTIDVRALDIDIMVEDRIEEANLLKKFCKVYLINKPYNIGFDSTGIIRINNILDLEGETWK